MKRVFLILALVLTVTAGGWAQTTFRQAFTVSTANAPAAFAKINESSANVGLHQLNWSVTGSVSGCTVQIESSAAGTVFALMTGSAAQTCTSSGSYAVPAQVNNYIRINVTAFTGTGSVRFSYVGIANTPTVTTYSSPPFVSLGSGIGAVGALLANPQTVCASSTPVTATNPSAAANLMTCALPAGFQNVAGKALLVCGAGLYTTAAGQTPTGTFGVKIGSSVTPLSIVSAATTASATNMPWNMCQTIITTTTGATGTLEASGWLMFTLVTTPAAAAAVYQGTNTAVSSALDLTAANTLAWQITFSSSNAGNSVSQRTGFVLALN